MAIPQSARLLRHLRQTVLRRDGAGLTDGQLLRSFLHRRDEAAFEALVRRHGPMVHGVCRRVLRDSHDAEDAFQAAFLVLLRKASMLATREVVGDWLHGVAYRTALKARAAAAHRRIKERQTPRREAILDEEAQAEWRPLLDQEIGRLPEKYRTPLVLCDLEGRTRKEAAQQLGWPEGTLSGRLSRARAMLARRLTRRGITLSAGALGIGLAGEVSACLPFSLVGSTCKAAMEFASTSAAPAVPAHLAALTEGVVKAMLLTKVKKVVALVMAALVLTAGVGAWRYAAVAGQTEEHPQERPARPVPQVDAAQTAEILPNPSASAVPKRDAAQTPVLPGLMISTAPFARRAFQIDLQIIASKDGQSKELATPRLLALEGTPASFASGDHRTIELGGGQTEKVAMGPTVRVVVRSDKGDKVHLDITVSWPTRATFRDGVILETKTLRHVVHGIPLGTGTSFASGDMDSTPLVVSVAVQEAKPDTGAKTISEAERDLKVAEYWRRKGHPGAAYYYYEQIAQTYTDTIYAERAKERLIEMEKQLQTRTDLSEADRFVRERLFESKRQLEKPRKKPAKREEKPPARVGQIFITGNKKIPDEVILDQVPLFPGQVLSYPDLRIFEKNLARHKGLKSNPTVTVIEREGDGVFKDIQITVEEK
jgi:RNA polymerase sigma factor (sigma-70 family)